MPNCRVCGKPGTHIEIEKIPRTIITRLGLVFEQEDEIHRFFCAEHRIDGAADPPDDVL